MNSSPKGAIAGRLEHVRALHGVATLKDFHQRVKDAAYSDEAVPSYAAVRTYHFDRDPPVSYLVLVSRAFDVSLRYLAQGVEGRTAVATTADPLSLAERLGAAIRSRFRTQQAFFDAMPTGVEGTTYPSLRSYIRDGVTPSLPFLKAAAEVCGVREAWLISGLGSMTNEEKGPGTAAERRKEATVADQGTLIVPLGPKVLNKLKQLADESDSHPSVVAAGLIAEGVKGLHRSGGKHGIN